MAEKIGSNSLIFYNNLIKLFDTVNYYKNSKQIILSFISKQFFLKILLSNLIPSQRNDFEINLI